MHRARLFGRTARTSTMPTKRAGERSSTSSGSGSSSGSNTPSQPLTVTLTVEVPNLGVHSSTNPVGLDAVSATMGIQVVPVNDAPHIVVAVEGGADSGDAGGLSVAARSSVSLEGAAFIQESWSVYRRCVHPA